MTDVVVLVFASIVTIILMSTAITTTVITIVYPKRDVTAATEGLTDVVTTLIAALVGFVAGKGTGKAEAHDERAKRDDDS